MDAQREARGDEPLDLSETAEQQLHRKERHAQVHAALQELSDEYRSILVLREMDGCCYETIAEMLELPIGTVRSRIHRARAQLRELLRGMLQQSS